MSWFSSKTSALSPTPTPTPDSALAATSNTPDVADVADVASTPIDTLVDAAAPPTPPPPKIRSIDDLRRLNRRATQEGMYAGVLGGGVLAYLAKRGGVSKNGLVLTFILGGTGISFLTTRTIINQTLGEHYEHLRAARAAQAQGGGGVLLADETAVGDMPAPTALKEEDPRTQLARELSSLGQGARERTRWTKGRGLDGEVEEEAELRDTYLRPGVPRNV